MMSIEENNNTLMGTPKVWASLMPSPTEVPPYKGMVRAATKKPK